MLIKAYSLVFGSEIEFEFNGEGIKEALREAEIKQLMSQPVPYADTREEALKIIAEAYGG
jgi:hypothetical protein